MDVVCNQSPFGLHMIDLWISGAAAAYDLLTKNANCLLHGGFHLAVWLRVVCS